MFLRFELLPVGLCADLVTADSSTSALRAFARNDNIYRDDDICEGVSCLDDLCVEITSDNCELLVVLGGEGGVEGVE